MSITYKRGCLILTGKHPFLTSHRIKPAHILSKSQMKGNLKDFKSLSNSNAMTTTGAIRFGFYLPLSLMLLQ